MVSPVRRVCADWIRLRQRSVVHNAASEQLVPPGKYLLKDRRGVGPPVSEVRQQTSCGVTLQRGRQSPGEASQPDQVQVVEVNFQALRIPLGPLDRPRVLADDVEKHLMRVDV